MLLFVFILFSCAGTDRTIAGAERGDSSGRTGTVGDGSTQDSTGIEKYRNLWERQTREKAYDEVIRSARFAFEKGESDGNRSLSVYATAYLAQSYMLKDDDDSTCYWLAESFERIGKLPREDLFIVGTVNNIAGIRAMKSESDYSSALRYFKAALSAVEKAGDTLNQGAILQNIAHIYQVREDVSGFDYALRSYELVAARGGVNARSTAAVVLSSMYVLKGDYAQALRYADISVARIDDSSYWDANKAYVWYNYGDVCASAGDDARAEASYRKALEYVPSAGTAIGIRAYVSFGNFCLKRKKYRGAVEMYRRAEELLGSGNVECRAPVYSGLARAYDASGDGAKALEYYRKYFGTCSTTVSSAKEHAFNELLMRYEQSEHQRAMGLKEMELLRKDRNIMAAVFAMLLVIGFFLYACLLYRRKNAMYRELVRQNLNYRERLNECERLEGVRKANAQQAQLKIYERLEALLRNEKIYRRKDLTLQMLAESLGTNTTYMSHIVNSFSGKSFPNYLNAYRIEEVLDALSDPSDDEPIHAVFERVGYTSRSTYLRIFRKEVGCAPSKYRQEIRKIRAERKNVRI